MRFANCSNRFCLTTYTFHKQMKWINTFRKIVSILMEYATIGINNTEPFSVKHKMQGCTTARHRISSDCNWRTSRLCIYTSDRVTVCVSFIHSFITHSVSREYQISRCNVLVFILFYFLSYCLSEELIWQFYMVSIAYFIWCSIRNNSFVLLTSSRIKIDKSKHKVQLGF